MFQFLLRQLRYSNSPLGIGCFHFSTFISLHKNYWTDKEVTVAVWIISKGRRIRNIVVIMINGIYMDGAVDKLMKDLRQKLAFLNLQNIMANKNIYVHVFCIVHLEYRLLTYK